MRAFLVCLICLPLVTACAAETPPQIDYQVRAEYPHDTGFFTQGLLFYQGRLYESTGQYGSSQLIRYAEDYSRPQIRLGLEDRFFGEGIALYNERLYLLTWRAGTALLYDPHTFNQLGSFNYSGEGWGLTTDGEMLWQSDGSAVLKHRDGDGQLLGELPVTLGGEPLDRLNELEYIRGLIFANRWYDNHIYLIEATTGEVVALMDLEELALPELARGSENVLNGIAWHPERETLWVTGKNWSRLYELEIDLPGSESP